MSYAEPPSIDDVRESMRTRNWLAAGAVAVLAVAGAASALTPLPLVGTVWLWSPPDDVDAARRYSLELRDDGTMQVQADCNRGKGRYEHRDDTLRLGPVAATKQACGGPSRGDEFVRRLAAIDGYRYEGVQLVLTTAGVEALRLVPDVR